MNRFAPVSEAAAPAALSIDLDALRRTPLIESPFPYAIVPHFVRGAALDGIRGDFPAIAHPGSFPLDTLSYGPAFARFMADLQGAAMTDVVAEKFAMDLSRSPTMVTVRGQSRAADGKIHRDSRTKLITALIYMNDEWESDKGRLRLVRDAERLDDVIAEVPPERGTLLIFRNDLNAWHGFEPFAGPRRVIQLNWVRDAGVVRREQNRHRVSAFFKRLRGR
jgi:SM-20-related protein